MELESKNLVDEARRGDRRAATELIEAFYKRIFAFLRRLSGSDIEAADLTQRTFSRVWKALPTFAGRSSISSWIHGIAYHVYVDWRRSDHRSEPKTDEWWSGCAAPGPAPDEVAATNDLAALVYASVEQLEADLRESVHLHYYQGLTLQETADAMGTATSTVKYRLRQALARLQNEFAADRPQLRTQ